MKPKAGWRNDRWVWILSVVALSGCTTTIDKRIVSSSLTLCHDQQCAPVKDENGVDLAMGGFASLVEDSLGKDIVMCEADRLNKVCKNAQPSVDLIGGILMGKASRESMRLSDINLDKSLKQLRWRHTNDGTKWMGTPVYCTDGTATAKGSTSGIQAEVDTYYCNWAAIGNIFFKEAWSIDHINLDTGFVGAYYQAKGAGIMCVAGGSGYAMIRLFPGTQVKNLLATAKLFYWV